MIKAVVFDLDGTLLDTIPDIANALNHGLAAYGLPTHPVRVCEQFVGGGIRQAVWKAVPAGTPDALAEQVLAEYLACYPQHCTENTQIYPGVEALLAGLDQLGLTLGVLSNKTEATARKIIASFFPGVPFRCVFGRVDGRPLKPDPAAAAPVLDALSLTAREIVYVGDSGTDMTFAHAAGMGAAAAAWGYRSRQELTEKGADWIAGTPEELSTLLRAAVLPGQYS